MSDTIIGTIIGVLSSVLVFGITNYIQWKRDNRNRAWELEDRKRQRRLDVLNKRLDEVTNFVETEYDIAYKLYTYEFNSLGNIEYAKNKQTFEEMLPLINKIGRNTHSFQNLNDEQLNSLNTEFWDLIGNEIITSQSLRSKIIAGEITDNASEQNRLSVFLVKTMKLKSRILKRIDELLGFDS